MFVGRVRRKGVEVRSLPEVLAAELPVELNMLDFCFTLEGLRVEKARIRVWLDDQVPGFGAGLLEPVLAAVGFDTAGWYRRVLTQSEGCSW